MYVITAIGTAFITLLPEVLSALKLRDKWTPINIFPYSISDDYHYFIWLNRLRNQFCTQGVRNRSEISPVVKSQFVLYLMYLVPYSASSIIFGTRVGILVCKFFVRAGSFYAILSLITGLFVAIKGHATPSSAIICFFIFLAVYPGVDNIGFRKSIANNIFHGRHTYIQGQPNDLLRGFILEGTMIISSIGMFILLGTFREGSTKSMLPILIVLFLAYFTYLPTGLALSFLSFVAAIYVKSFTHFLAVVFISSLALLLNLLVTRRDHTMVEIYPTSSKQLFKLPDKETVQKSIILLPVTLFGLVGCFSSDSRLLWNLALILSAFSLFRIFLSNFVARIWNRGLLPIWSLIYLVSLISSIPRSWATREHMVFLLAVFVTLFCKYFLSQYRESLSTGLFELREMTSKELGYLRNFELNQSSLEADLDVSRNLQFAFAVDAFTRKSSEIQNFTTQLQGYKLHLPHVISWLINRGFSDKEILHLLCFDHQPETGYFRIDEKLSECKTNLSYLLQVYATYFTENRKLTEDNMRINGKWSEGYKGFIEDLIIEARSFR